nr:MAG TPA: hypothetical protein [Caudoviricetes sp.]DAW14271.1 MAG TPA: hypothetical protein [Caudoviricetes sp.]
MRNALLINTFAVQIGLLKHFCTNISRCKVSIKKRNAQSF